MIDLAIGLLGGVVGCVSVSLGRPLVANLVWVATNPFMVYHNIVVHEYGQAVLWAIYVGIAAFGVFYNRRKNGTPKG
jgi:hypothetical protein